ncbi:MAG TPA: Trp biosynthesis-associated membrane protein, partial [Marmoricola sp.]
MTDPQPAQRSAWLPVLVGLAGAVFTAVAAAKPWASAGAAAKSLASAGLSGAGEEPLALALALVALAAWGAVLVTRGRFRLVIVVVGLLSALGVFVT